MTNGAQTAYLSDFQYRTVFRKRVYLWKAPTMDISCTYQGETVSCNERARPGTRAKLSCKQSYNLPPTDDPVYREIVYLDDALWDGRVFSCLPEFSTSKSHGNILTYVVNGFYSKVVVFFPMVRCKLLEETKSNNSFTQICEDIVICKNFAAHCFYDEVFAKIEDTSRYYVAVGKYYRSWEARENYVQKAPAEKIIFPDRYIGARGNYVEDIDLLKLAKPFELTVSVKPICLDWDNIYERKQLRVLEKSGMVRVYVRETMLEDFVLRCMEFGIFVVSLTRVRCGTITVIMTLTLGSPMSATSVIGYDPSI
ncbi:hypothetical protein M0802_006372 [Mischocyttarus mexicanus]|nr:hypothetical protein M0802_006372 [Mischocyttarus mexicanus]